MFFEILLLSVAVVAAASSSKGKGRRHPPGKETDKGKGKKARFETTVPATVTCNQGKECLNCSKYRDRVDASKVSLAFAVRECPAGFLSCGHWCCDWPPRVVANQPNVACKELHAITCRETGPHDLQAYLKYFEEHGYPDTRYRRSKKYIAGVVTSRAERLQQVQEAEVARFLEQDHLVEVAEAAQGPAAEVWVVFDGLCCRCELVDIVLFFV
jgi:hypothetical protein